MRIFILILVNFLILNIRLWITRQIFHISQKNKNTHIVRTTLFVGIFVAFSIFVYPYIIQYFWYDMLNYLDTNKYPSREILWWIVWYSFIIFIFQMLFKRSTPSIFWLKEVLLWILLLWWSYFLLHEFHVLPIIIYYLLVASSEEGLKYLSSAQIYKKQHFMTSDLILYALLVSLGFAFFENIIYMIQSTQVISLFSREIGAWTQILLSRGVIGFLVHMLFTGSIATLSVYAIQKWKHFIYLLWALFVGIVLHMSYNIFLHYHITWIIIFYLIAWYFMLTWIFWKSESMYIQNTTK